MLPDSEGEKPRRRMGSKILLLGFLPLTADFANLSVFQRFINQDVVGRDDNWLWMHEIRDFNVYRSHTVLGFESENKVDRRQMHEHGNSLRSLKRPLHLNVIGCIRMKIYVAVK